MSKVTDRSLARAYAEAFRIMLNEPAIDASVKAGDVEIDGVWHEVVVKIEENED